MLTARGEETDRIVGLELGADDYVTKPFSPRELAARVRTVLRRSAPRRSGASGSTFGDLEIDAGDARGRAGGGEPLQLTAKEFDLLWFLARNPRQVFSRDQLMDRVWGYAAALDTGTVTVHIRRLREKIEADPSQPRHLETVWGVGYRFVAVTDVAILLAAATLAAGLARRVRDPAAAARPAPARRARAARRRRSRSRPCSPPGWVMFHMEDDAKILSVAAASALSAVVAALLLARWILGPLDRLRGASRRARRRRPRPPARPTSGPRELAELGAPLQRDGRARSRSSSTPAASSSPGRATTCARRSRRCTAMLEAIEDGLAEPDEYLPALHDQVRQLTALVDDLFELARIDAGDLTLELAETPLDGIVERCLRGLTAEARARHVRLHAELDRRPAIVRCAPDKVERVLFNLLTNALRHTPDDGSIAVHVHPAEQASCRGRGHRRRPRARGRGPDVRALLARRASAQLEPAPGLGLAIARGLVEAQGGHLGREPPTGRRPRRLHAARRTRLSSARPRPAGSAPAPFRNT